MEFDVFTLLPEVFPPYLNSSIMHRARQHGLIDVRIHNIRDWAADKHHVTDPATPAPRTSARRIMPGAPARGLADR